MMSGFNGLGFGGPGFGIGMFLFWGLIIGLVVLALRGFGAGSAGRAERSALDILRERYARGEIDKSEFERKREDLRVAR